MLRWAGGAEQGPDPGDAQELRRRYWEKLAARNHTDLRTRRTSHKRSRGARRSSPKEGALDLGSLRSPMYQTINGTSIACSSSGLAYHIALEEIVDAQEASGMSGRSKQSETNNNNNTHRPSTLYETLLG
uniref:Uncharacterized protein n=1 Tax=Anopheles merus TaxID=30066 RepID=A0A182UPB1_ANOME